MLRFTDFSENLFFCHATNFKSFWAKSFYKTFPLFEQWFKLEDLFFLSSLNLNASFHNERSCFLLSAIKLWRVDRQLQKQQKSLPLKKYDIWRKRYLLSIISNSEFKFHINIKNIIFFSSWPIFKLFISISISIDKHNILLIPNKGIESLSQTENFEFLFFATWWRKPRLFDHRNLQSFIRGLWLWVAKM